MGQASYAGLVGLAVGFAAGFLTAEELYASRATKTAVRKVAKVLGGVAVCAALATGVSSFARRA